MSAYLGPRAVDNLRNRAIGTIIIGLRLYVRLRDIPLSLCPVMSVSQRAPTFKKNSDENCSGEEINGSDKYM